MRRSLLVVLMMLTPATLLGQSSLAGDWQATVHFFGSNQYATIHFEQTGDKVTGTIFGTKIECQLQLAVCAGTVREGDNPPNGTIRLTLKNGEIAVYKSAGAQPERIPVTGGFAEVNERGLTVLAESAGDA